MIEEHKKLRFHVGKGKEMMELNTESKGNNKSTIYVHQTEPKP